MPYIRNPFGRIVSTTPELYKDWLTKPGFMKLSPEEEQAHIEQARFDDKVRSLTEHPDPNFQEVYLMTTNGNSDGYAMSGDYFQREMKKMGVYLNRTNRLQKIGLIYQQPEMIVNMKNEVKLIYTMFEADKIPAGWDKQMGMADEVIVPSKWCAKVFGKYGIKCTVVPLGYNENIFKYVERENKEKAGKTFNFLHYNAFNTRKGFTELFQAFTQEFGHDEPVKLILKTTTNYQHSSFPIVPSMYPNIKVIVDNMSEQGLLDLMADSDCFVFPSRGEGFGMTPCEAMATGMPCIVPNAHGITEYFDKRYMYDAPLAGFTPALYEGYKGQQLGNMTICDVKELRKQMRYVYEHQDEALKKGKLASEYIKKYSLHNTAVGLKHILKKYA